MESTQILRLIENAVYWQDKHFSYDFRDLSTTAAVQGYAKMASNFDKTAATQISSATARCAVLIHLICLLTPLPGEETYMTSSAGSLLQTLV